MEASLRRPAAASASASAAASLDGGRGRGDRGAKPDAEVLAGARCPWLSPLDGACACAARTEVPSSLLREPRPPGEGGWGS